MAKMGIQIAGGYIRKDLKMKIVITLRVCLRSKKKMIALRKEIMCIYLMLSYRSMNHGFHFRGEDFWSFVKHWILWNRALMQLIALPKIIKTGFSAINLIYFFTAGPDEDQVFIYILLFSSSFVTVARNNFMFDWFLGCI